MRQITLLLVGFLGLLLAAGCSSGGDNDGQGTHDRNETDGTDTTTSGTSSETGSNSDSTDNSTISSSDTDSNECANQDNEVNINPINMLILLDRSRSMELSHVGNDTDNPNDTYAAVVATALKQVVSTYDATDLINFGLAVFPAMDCLPGDEDPDVTVQCKPASTLDSPLVEIGPDNSTEIESQLNTVGTCGGTPISSSLSWSGTYIDTLAAQLKAQDTYVLLATDGAPNCNDANHKDVDVCDCTTTKTPQGNCPSKILCLDDSATYNAAVQLKQKGVKVFVIGVGNQLAEWDGVMNNIANYGGTSTYYPANNPATLNDALETITGKAVECTFDVIWDEVPLTDEHGEIVDKRCNKVRVFGKTAAGAKEAIAYSYGCADPTGWQWQDLNKEMNPDGIDTTPLDQCSVIELCPDACKALKQATYTTVSASFGCGVVPVQ